MNKLKLSDDSFYPLIPSICECGKCNRIIFKRGIKFISGHNANRKGIKQNQEWKINKSKMMKGKHNSQKTEWKKGKVAWNKGLHPSIETIEKLSKSHIIDGRSFEPYSIEFNLILKESIRLRDSYTCQICHKTQVENFKKIKRKLCIHHVNYNKKDNRLNNLISLCGLCHLKTNHFRKYYEQYFALILDK